MHDHERGEGKTGMKTKTNTRYKISVRTGNACPNADALGDALDSRAV